MAVSIISGTNDKPVASRALEDIVSGWSHLSGKLFIGFPVIGTYEGPRRIDAFWASEDAGFVAFDLVEGTDYSGYQRRQDDFANAVESKLRSRSDLIRRSHKRRDLVVPVHTATFAPGVSHLPSDAGPDYPIANRQNLANVLAAFGWPADDAGHSAFDTALSTLENISTIRRTGDTRSFDRPDSRGAKLKRLEDSVATLDAQQAQAMIETAEGIQRIRGLAGSGKTIVLALKAAYLHAMHPEWRIAITFHTRSLKDFFGQLVNDFFVSQTNQAPDWAKLRIIHAWGAPGEQGRDGIYHQFCRDCGATYLDLGRARSRFGPANPFGDACRFALKDAKAVEPLYEVILVDEAQDLPPAFLRICYKLLTQEKRLVYAYDELQNLGQEPLPSPDQLFGERTKRPRSASAADIVLGKCYRNSRPVLATAHALGFGIYRSTTPDTETGVVKMFDQPEMWRDVGYRSMNGDICDGTPVVLARSDDTSPLFLEEHSEPDDLVQFMTFENVDEQTSWVANQVEQNLGFDELRPEEIVVINPDPISTAAAVGPIRALLLDKNIQNHLAGVDTAADVFRQPDSVTFTGIHHAKGNEFGMVYVINAHDCYSGTYNLARIRNRLFAAITRSKAWVRVCGVGDDMLGLANEYSRLKRNDYEMRFVYPTESQRKNMRVVHRDFSDAEARRLQEHKKALLRLAEDVRAGRVYPEDLQDIGPVVRELLVREGNRERGKS